MTCALLPLELTAHTHVHSAVRNRKTHVACCRRLQADFDSEPVCAQGSRTGFTRCIHVSDGNYSQDTANKVPFLVLWSALTSWQTGGFTMVLCIAMFGWDNWRRVEKVVVIGSVTAFTLLVIGGSVHYGWALDKPASTLAGPGERRLHLALDPGLNCLLLSGKTLANLLLSLRNHGSSGG